MQYVAERTHLMARVIEALETENFKKIPAPVYGRGFIRQYCALLELDPQPLLDEYAAICSGAARPTTVRPPGPDHVLKRKKFLFFLTPGIDFLQLIGYN